MKNILTEALVNSATNASFIFQLYKFCKVKDASDLIKVEIIKNMIDTKYDTKYNGGEKMSSWDKLLKRFLELDYDIRFEEIVKVMKEYGYEIKQSVTHL